MSNKTALTMQPFDPSQGRKDKRVSLINVSRAVNRRIKVKPSVQQDYQKLLKFAWVPAQLCYINYARQRYPEPTHIKKLHQKWNLMCVTPLQARYSSKENRYYIADGQQHGIDWVLQYGEDSLVPVFYVESEDETIESIQLLALNTDNEPMAKYFIHEQEVIMGVQAAVDLERAVQRAGCSTGYKRKNAGVITHISDLNLARDHFGVKNLELVLSKMMQYWPTERIFTATMFGFLKTKEQMEQDGVYTDELFEDVFYQASEFFESSQRLHQDIKNQFMHVYPSNYKGMGVREKIASGIISAYEQRTGNSLCQQPFGITMPCLKKVVDED